MGLRMPQFGAANVGGLPEQLAAADGVEPADAIRQFDYDPAHVEAGRSLVGSNGFGCISCHDIAGRPNTGTRGPDLAAMSERVRFDWYSRWLDDPQRMQPGTRMPTVFQNGKTAIKTVLNGDASAQSQAIWEYLSLGANLPLPEGLAAPRGLVLEPAAVPIVIRTFMPDSGTRSFAVGFPSGVSFAFDAGQCRLAYGWTGQFLDATPTWQNRGGFPAGVPGPRFWMSPAGFPWGLSESPARPPDWDRLQADPSRGAVGADGKLYDGPKRLHFRDYSIAADGPAFQYTLVDGPDSGQTTQLTIGERFQPLQKLAGVGVERSFELLATEPTTAWLLLAQGQSAPRIITSQGAPTDFEPTGPVSDHSAGGHPVLVSTPSGPVILVVRAAPPETLWSFSRSDGPWRVSLRIPVTTAEQATRIAVVLWTPYRNEPAMLRALLE
jgi:hypothetical protein